MFGVGLAVGIMFLVALVAVPAGTALGMLMVDELETRTWITPTVWKEARELHVEADELKSAMSLGHSKWTWALIQWQVHHKRMMNPSHTWKEIAVASQQTRSDESVMAKLDAEIEERNRRIAEQEAWQEE